MTRNNPNSKLTLTDWYPPHIKPVRPGVYERKMRDGYYRYAYFGGTVWYLSCPTIEQAHKTGVSKDRDLISAYQNLRWRGVVK